LWSDVRWGAGARTRTWGPSRLLVLLACAALALQLAVPAGAEPGERVQEARDQVERAERDLSGATSDAAAAEERLEELEVDFALAVEAYNEAQAALDEAREKVAEAREELAEVEARIGENEDQAGDFVRRLYQHGSGFEFEALLGAEDLTDAQMRAVYLRSTAQTHYTIVETLKVDRTVQATVLAQLRELEAEAADAERELAAQREHVEGLVEAQQEERDELRAVVAAAEADLQAAQTELSEAEEEHRREQERLERERREREAAERAAREAAERAAREAAQQQEQSSSGSSGTPASSDRAQQAVDAALSQVGKPYQWGAAGPDSYDCSGLTMWAWRQAGVSLPRTSRQQYAATQRISRSELRPGDFVFFAKPGRPIHHMAMYIGNGDVVEAPFTGENVRVNSRSLSRSDIYGYGRVTH
jgi:peptidoglycan DL-endopeptidase CwlO